MTDTVAKVTDLEKIIQKNEAQLHQRIVESSEEMKVDIGGLKTSYGILEKDCKTQMSKLESLKGDIKVMLKSETEQIITGLKSDQEWFNKMELKIRSLDTLKLQVDTINASMNQLVQNVSET